MKNCSLGLFIGESFAELSLLDTKTKEKLDFQRWYLPRANLKSFLSKYISEKSITQLDRVFVAHRFLEKLFSYRLGGSVAQIVTSGFEKALPLEETSISDSYIWPLRPPALSSSELVFSLHEKVDGDGQVIKPVDLAALEAISSKLKMMEVKRVCLHLHGSCLNPLNSNIAKEYLETNGFDVYLPPRTEPHLEFQAWRKNLIEAAITGTFLEIQEDLSQSLSSVVGADKIYFLGADLKWFQNEKHERLGSLVALENLWMSLFPKILKANEKVDIFHFGLENFSLIKSEESHWELAWGLLPVKSHKRKDFRVQPTQSLKISEGNELTFDRRELSFEPGPISMGRGVVPCVYDILYFTESAAPEAQEKIKRSLQALLKSTGKSSSPVQSAKLLKENILDQLAFEIEFSKSPSANETIIYGVGADLLQDDLKKHSYFSKMKKISEKDWAKSYLIGHWGLRTDHE